MATMAELVAAQRPPTMVVNPPVDPFLWETIKLRSGVDPREFERRAVEGHWRNNDTGAPDQIGMNVRDLVDVNDPSIFGGDGSVTRNPDGTYRVWRHTAHGSGKYDMVAANYKFDPATGQLTRVSDWSDADRTPSKDDYVDLAKFAALAAAGGFGVNALGGALGGATGAGTATGGSAAATTGASAAEAFKAAELAAMNAGGAGAAGAAAAPAGVNLVNAGGVMSTAAPSMAAAAGAAVPGASGGGITGTLSAAGKFLADNPTLAKLGLTALTAGLAGGGGSADTSSIAGVGNQAATLGKEALEWFKSIYAEQKPARDAAAQRANEISDAQLAAMKFATDEAKELSGYNKSTFRPVEARIVNDAMTWDSPARMAQAAADATADVRTAIAGQQGALTRSLNRAGVMPGSGRMLSMANDIALEGAKAEGGAATTARRNVELQGQQLRMGAASLGRGIPAQQVQQQQIATGAGSASVGSSQAGLDAKQSGIAPVTQGYTTAMQGLNTAGNLYSQAARINAGQGNDDLASMVALMQGIGAMGLFK